MSSTSDQIFGRRRGRTQPGHVNGAPVERLASLATFLAVTALALFLIACFIGVEFGGSTFVALVEQVIEGTPVQVADSTVGGEAHRVITFAR